MRINILLIAALIFSTSLNAQYYDSSPSLVLGGQVTVPTGVLSEKNGPGAGISGKLRLPTGQLSDIILTADVSLFSGKNVTVLRNKIPVTQKTQVGKVLSAFVGYRHYLNPLSDYNSFYLQGDLGLSAITSKLINFSIAPSLGYLINDRIDLTLRYHTILTGPERMRYSYLSLGIAYGLNFN